MAASTHFQVTHSGVNHSFDIGDSDNAKTAIALHNSYKENPVYESLKNCFSELHWAVDVTNKNRKKFNYGLCRACHFLALSVIQNLNIYEQLFVCSSVAGIIEKSGLTEKYASTVNFWKMAGAKIVNEKLNQIEMDPVAAKRAGLAVLEIE